MTQPITLLSSPPEWRVKLRDKLAPRWRLRLRTADGDLPFDSADLVATKLRRGDFERAELAILVDLLPHCAGFVDVGANLGLYSLLAARRMPRGHVAAFEASAIEFDKLSWTIRENRLANVTAIHAAISDDEGEATIHESLFGAGALNRLDGPAKPTGNWRATRVRKTSLDRYFAMHPQQIDLIKIDVEGHELPVLRGASSLLATSSPLIMIEVNPSRASEQSTPAGIFEFLRSRGYAWYAIEEAGVLLRAVDVPAGTINYFAVPKTRSDALVAVVRERAAP